jgi:hypothetical protein
MDLSLIYYSTTFYNVHNFKVMRKLGKIYFCLFALSELGWSAKGSQHRDAVEAA